MNDTFFGESFCVPSATEVVLCIDSDLVEAMNQLERETVAEDCEPVSIHELSVLAIVDHLRACGRLPKPYV